MAEWLANEYNTNRGGGFNYDPAIRATFDLFRGAITAERAIEYCGTLGNPKGRKANTEAIAEVCPYAVDNISTCYHIGFTAVAVGRFADSTVYIGIKAPMVRVNRREAFVVMPGFRKGHRPTEVQIDLACSIALATFARDDFAGADFEYLYAGPGASGKREFRAILGRDRKIFDRDSIDSLLDVYVNGVALAAKAGADIRPPKMDGYRIIDPREPGFWDSPG